MFSVVSISVSTECPTRHRSLPQLVGCAKDVYIAIVSTIVETDKPEFEIVPGLQLLGPIFEK